MIDACLIQYEHEGTAKEIFLIIGLALQLKNEDKPPFAYLGPCVNFNGIDIKESNTHIMISCQSYTDWMLCAHEAEFLATVSCAKITLYLWLILYKFGFECNESTLIYEYNVSIILIANSAAPTKRAQHVYV